MKLKLPKVTLVQLALKRLLQVFSITEWGMGDIQSNVHICIEKEEGLGFVIHTIRCAYAKRVRMAWDVTH
jgi:hypothetical protein